MTYYDRMNYYELYHHGVRGQRWGLRRYQNPDGSLTAAGRARLDREERKLEIKDEKYLLRKAKKYGKKVNKIEKRVMGNDRSLRQEKKLLKKGLKKNPFAAEAAITMYNKRLSDVMNKKYSNLKTRTGRGIEFVAKVGELGVYTRLKDYDYSAAPQMQKLKSKMFGE